jgi:hypothetical protein
LHGHAAGGKKTDTIAYMTPKEADNLQTEERGQNSLSSKKKIGSVTERLASTTL